MIQQLNELFTFMNTPENSFAAAFIFLLCSILVLALRIIICIGYQAQYTMFGMSAKKFKGKDDIKNIKRGVIGKVLNDYIANITKGNTGIQAVELVDKHIRRLKIFGLAYETAENMIYGFEKNFLLLGLILVFTFNEYAYVFCFLTLLVFVVNLILANIFDYKIVKNRLKNELAEFTGKELSIYYPNETAGLLVKFKNELATALVMQTDSIGSALSKHGKNFSDTIGSMSVSLSGLIDGYLVKMNKEVENALLRVANTDVLSKPLAEWTETVKASAAHQQKINKTFDNMNVISTKLEKSTGLLSSGFESYNNTLNTELGNLKKAIMEQVEAAGRAASGLETGYNQIERQIKYIDQNQMVLADSLQKYELSLTEITQKIGDGLAAIVSHSMDMAYERLNKEISGNITDIVKSNTDLTERLSELFGTLANQSRMETQAILSIRDQIGAK